MFFTQIRHISMNREMCRIFDRLYYCDSLYRTD